MLTVEKPSATVIVRTWTKNQQGWKVCDWQLQWSREKRTNFHKDACKLIKHSTFPPKCSISWPSNGFTGFCLRIIFLKCTHILCITYICSVHISYKLKMLHITSYLLWGCKWQVLLYPHKWMQLSDGKCTL